MTANRWDTAGVPHKGWTCVDVIDLRADGEPADETDYATCQMCGNEKIRYVHVMAHPALDEHLEVGCVCAEKMSDDYEGPKRREATLRNRAVRRARWLRRKWRVSAKGNSFLNLEGYNLVVYPTKAGSWGYKIGGRFGGRTYPTSSEAKLALFDDFWAATKDHPKLWSS
ncbi:hypothetical protein [Fulvimonas yonginensis]|uniref:AP2 domain-containing protein n=1 Tax=Fulvimonas yonginensis TaxID=1495200 RepID=A0ABU8JF75_9GAMM